MRILTVLTYYSPHISGLTVYARRLARSLTEQGHEVTVLTSHYAKDLPREEVIEGTTVVRSPVLWQLSKGVAMPLYPSDVSRLVASHDLLHLHLPQLEASVAAVIAKAMRKPVVTTYHCDIELPPGLVRAVTTPVIRASHYLTGKLSDRIVVNTREFGHAARLPRHFHKKVDSVYPPIELARSGNPADLRRRWNLPAGPLVGFVGRFSQEKGIDDLIDSVPHVLRAVPGARFVLAGLTATVPGEHVHERLEHKIRALGDRWVHLGLLSDEELATFYRMVDVIALPSTNSTESFGMCQAEAMLAGTPVVATDIPGVREAVRVTGMGILVPVSDPAALGQAIADVLENRPAYQRPEREIKTHFDPAVTAAFYVRLFTELTGEPVPAPAPAAPARSVTPPAQAPGRSQPGRVSEMPAPSRRR